MSLVSYETSPLQDCETGIKDFFNSKLFIVGYVGIGIAGVMVSREKRKVRNAHTYAMTDNKMFLFAALQIIGMIFSMVLCCAIRNSREVI